MRDRTAIQEESSEPPRKLLLGSASGEGTVARRARLLLAALMLVSLFVPSASSARPVVIKKIKITTRLSVDAGFLCSKVLDGCYEPDTPGNILESSTQAPDRPITCYLEWVFDEPSDEYSKYENAFDLYAGIDCDGNMAGLGARGVLWYMSYTQMAVTAFGSIDFEDLREGPHYGRGTVYRCGAQGEPRDCRGSWRYDADYRLQTWPGWQWHSWPQGCWPEGGPYLRCQFRNDAYVF